MILDVFGKFYAKSRIRVPTLRKRARPVGKTHRTLSEPASVSRQPPKRIMIKVLTFRRLKTRMIRYTLILCLPAMLMLSERAMAQAAKTAPPSKSKAVEKYEEMDDKKSYKAFKKQSRRTDPTNLLKEAAVLKDK